MISILLPALAKARAAAQSVQCLSNLRQIGIAVNVYISDYAGYLPPCRIPLSTATATDPFMAQYLPAYYMGNEVDAFFCPADQYMRALTPAVERPRFADLETGALAIRYSYAHNSNMPRRSGQVYTGKSAGYFNPGLMNLVKEPAGYGLYFETGQTINLAASSPRQYFRADHPSGTANVIFLDGHASSLPLDAIQLDTYSTPGTFPTGFAAMWFGASSYVSTETIP